MNRGKFDIWTILKFLIVGSIVFLGILWIVSFLNGQALYTITELMAPGNMDNFVYYLLLPLNSVINMLSSEDLITWLTGFTNVVTAIVFTVYIIWPEVDDYLNIPGSGKTHAIRQYDGR